MCVYIYIYIMYIYTGSGRDLRPLRGEEDGHRPEGSGVYNDPLWEPRPSPPLAITITTITTIITITITTTMTIIILILVLILTTTTSTACLHRLCLRDVFTPCIIQIPPQRRHAYALAYVCN